MKRDELPLVVDDIRRTVDMFTEPCNCGDHGCFRGLHIWHSTAEFAGVTPTWTHDGSPHDFADEMRESLNLLAQFGTIIYDAGSEHAIAQLHQAAITLELKMAYLNALDEVIGDLPRIVRLASEKRPTGHYTDNAGTLVYTAFNDNDDILYVGVTDNLFARMNQHQRSSKWWRNMARITWEEWPDRDAALRKEAILIRRWRPPFNTAGNPDAKAART